MTLNRTRSLQLFLATAAVMAAGCGDGPICPSEIVVVIQSPSDGGNLSSAEDLDPASAGIQTSVAVRSNFKSGTTLTLTVTDERTGAVSQHNANTSSDGDASFTSVTLPAGPVTLTAEGSSDCGSGSDEVAVNVITDALCDLSIAEGPLANDFYAPIPVLNSSNDSDAALPNFQANLSVQSAPGFAVEVFVLDVAAGSEASIGTATADADGLASLEATLAQGHQAIRATCILAGASAASATSTAFVDTVVPACTLTSPVEGVTVTPDDDEDTDLINGIQMTWTGSVNDNGEGDVEGESASFFRGTTEFAGSDIDGDGGSATTSPAQFTAPGTYDLSFETQDHADNACVGGFSANVIMDGCSIAITAPTQIVTADSDATEANGLQTNVTVQVGTECAGQSVFVGCGSGEVSATVPGNGTTAVANVTLANSVIAEGTTTCTARVTNTDNFETSNELLVSFDTQAPGGSLDFTFPTTLACGDTIVRDTANDATGNLADGFQISARVIAGAADSREITVTNSVCVTPCVTAAPAGGAVVNLDITDGANDIRALTSDAQGNVATTPECIIRLEDIAVDIVDPVATGLLGSNSPGATVNGDGDLEITVCATVSETLVTASLEIDGATTEPMSFNAGLGQFCTNTAVVLTEGNHQLVATAVEIAGVRQGSDTVTVNVDLTAPAGPTGLFASAPNRRDIDASWSTVAGADHYVLKFSTTPFTADFANEGEEVTGVGTATSFTITPLDAGTEYFIGVAASDAAGNLSAADTLGPILPLLDGTGAIEAPDLATANALPRRFGQSVVSGNFNNDSFDDIAVSAPFKSVGGNSFIGEVYIYFGGANGIGAAPDVTITGAAPFTTFGFAITRLNWTATAADGLAIGAPNGGGAVYIFNGATLSSGATSLSAGDADVEIVPNATANWFSNAQLGRSLASGQLNAASSLEDLIIGVPQGNGSIGGALVLYGRAPNAGTITLSENATSVEMAGLEGHLFENPLAAANGSGLGSQVAYLGDTRTAGTGDLAVAYLADTSGGNLEDHKVYVIRGRTPSGVSGITFITLQASDLTVENPTADTSNAFGMQMGSIADQDGDGRRDLLVTGNLDGTGRLWIVSGSRTGTVVLNSDTDYLTRISATAASAPEFASGTPLFGSAVANNAAALDPDINGDGVEDLVVGGGIDGVAGGGETIFPGLFIWYGGSIPVGDTTAASANYVIAASAEFKNNNVGGQPNAMQLTWAGDVNNDALPDVCWADWTAGVGTETEGRFEILWDDPSN